MTDEQSERALAILGEIRDAQHRSSRWVWVVPVGFTIALGLGAVVKVQRGGLLRGSASGWRFRRLR